MLEAIAAYRIEGVETTLPFGTFVCKHPAFISGDFDTHFVQNHFTPEAILTDQEEEASIAAHLGALLMEERYSNLTVPELHSKDWLRKKER
jgi:acetyl/propionyl-CoA carboxylase alpha subunit